MSESLSENPSLLLVDDDETYCSVLSAALTSRGFNILVAHSVPDALKVVEQDPPEYAVVDLCMPGPTGLELVKQLIELDPNTRIVMLTGFASIATAVEAIKLGAIHYLSKPADADEILQALHKDKGDTSVPISKQPQSVRRLEWEHIQKILKECDGNISETARQLGMHRRTLQRKLAKHPVRS
jgi:two-component system response regulator RegA